MKRVGFERVYLASNQGFGLLDLVHPLVPPCCHQVRPLWLAWLQNFSATLAPRSGHHKLKTRPLTWLALPFFLSLYSRPLGQKVLQKFPTLSCLLSSQNPTTLSPNHSWSWQNFLSLLPSHSRFLVEKKLNKVWLGFLIFVNNGVTYL